MQALHEKIPLTSQNPHLSQSEKLVDRLIRRANVAASSSKALVITIYVNLHGVLVIGCDVVICTDGFLANGNFMFGEI